MGPSLLKGPYQWKGEVEEGGPERWQHERTWPDLISFEDGGREPTDEAHGWPLRAGESSGKDSPRSPLKETPSADILMLAQGNSFQGSDLQNHTIINCVGLSHYIYSDLLQQGQKNHASFLPPNILYILYGEVSYGLKNGT